MSERPPAGLARGPYAVPSAAVLSLAAALVIVTLAYYFFRIRRRGQS